MKRLKRVLLLCLVVALSVGFSSCDSKEESWEIDVTGIWELKDVSNKLKLGNEDLERKVRGRIVADFVGIRYIFSNGKVALEDANKELVSKGEYSQDKNGFYLKFEDGRSYNFKMGKMTTKNVVVLILHYNLTEYLNKILPEFVDNPKDVKISNEEAVLLFTENGKELPEGGMGNW